MSFGSSQATLGLILQEPQVAQALTRIGAFGIVRRFEVPLLYPYIDPPGAGDAFDRVFSFSVKDELFIFGKLFRQDNGQGIGDQIVEVVFEDIEGIILARTMRTGGSLGEFSTVIAPNTLPPGGYTVTLRYLGSFP